MKEFLEIEKICADKIKTIDELIEEVGPFPRKEKLIMCHGTFDVVHPGHIRHLIYAKSKASKLVASLTCDDHITKDNFRPFIPEQLRSMNLAALELVDYVIIDNNPSPLENIKKLQPDYFAKGYEYVEDGMHLKTKEEIEVLTSFGGEIIFTPGDVVHSSTQLLKIARPSLTVEKLIVLLDGEGLTLSDLSDAFKEMSKLKVHVVGDLIVDTYTNCTTIGSGSKTPTLSVKYEYKTDFVGGAGVVAKHLRSAGANVTFTTVLGDDELKNYVVKEMDDIGVKLNAIIDPTRPTTNKNAIVAEGYKLLKVDTVDNRSISDKFVDKICDYVQTVESDIIVFSDFHHGIFNKGTVKRLCASIPEDRLKVADSQVASRWGNILAFKGFDLITPNEREARFALGDQDSVIRPLASKLFKEAECKLLILKMGDRGCLIHRTRPEGDPRAIATLDSFARTVVDPVGAGDAFLSYATLGLAATGNDIIASVLGAMAAGKECEYEGNRPISQDDLKEVIQSVHTEITYQN